MADVMVGRVVAGANAEPPDGICSSAEAEAVGDDAGGGDVRDIADEGVP